MNSARLLLVALLALGLGCTPSRGGGGGGDDDDDDGGNNNSSDSTAWLRVTRDWGDGPEIEHNLVIANYPNVCNSMRNEWQLFDSLEDQYDADYEDVIDEFGSDEAPGAQEALCELDKDYYAAFVNADLPLLEPGAERTNIGLRGLADANSTDLPPGAYDYDADSSYFWGDITRMDDPSWFSDWASVDCSNPDAVQQHSENYGGLSFWEIEQGILWISAPSSNVRGATTEDVVKITDDEAEDTSPFTLDDEFTACDIDRTEN